MDDPYAVLGVDRAAGDDELKAARRRLAREQHPDVGGSAERMAEVNAAYDLLIDPLRRAQFDADGSTADTPAAVEARALVLDLFERALTRGEPNPVHYARQQVRAGRETIASQIAKLRADLLVLGTRAGLVRSRGPENLYEFLRLQRMRKLDGEIVLAERRREVGDAALQLLDVYECDSPVIAQSRGYGPAFARFSV